MFGKLTDQAVQAPAVQVDAQGNVMAKLADDGLLYPLVDVNPASFLNVKLSDDQVEQIAKKVIELLAMHRWQFVGQSEPNIEERTI